MRDKKSVTRKDAIMKKEKHVVLGVTGSIAAYKAAELVRLIVGKKWTVSVVMTESAALFVSELTFQTLSREPVMIDMFEQAEDWEPGHVSMADRADVLLIAPCTANVMAKLAHGIADDALTAVALACDAPLLVAPAMNEKMWKHPATRANLAILKKRGAEIINVERGDLACGHVGQGRMACVETIISALEKKLKAG